MPVLIAPAAWFAVARAVFALETEVEQRGQPLVGFEEDVAAVAAIAARRAAARHELLSAESHRARPAVAGLHANFRFVDELQD